METENINKKKYKCTEPGCKAEFSKNNKLQYHLRTHTGERPFVCNEPNCTKSYTNSTHLRRHKNAKHNENKQEDSVICEYANCGLVFVNRYSYKKHYNRKHNPDNTNKNPFQCKDCNVGFKKKKQLQQHSYIHTGIAPFKCDKCDVSCTTIIAMTKHKKQHKSYKCGGCDEIYHRWTVLLAHRRECPKVERKIICQHCKKSFKLLSNYYAHIRTLKKKEERFIYPCPYVKCRRFYMHKRNLMIHINSFHKQLHIQINQCNYPFCGQILQTKVSYKRHLLRHQIIKEIKPRNPRHDKGIRKKCIASILSGKLISLKLHRKIIKEKQTDQENQEH